MPLAPLVLFVYNRPDHTRRTLEALAAADLASESLLYVYADGPKHGASDAERARIEQVREVVRSRAWCGEVKLVIAERNLGLAASIVGGVTEVVNRHGRVIVLEDDIVVRKGFLRYMNDALAIYADEPRAMQVNACTYGDGAASGQDTFFLKVLACHGWGTWSRAWAHYNDDVLDHMAYFQSCPQRAAAFDIEGAAYFMEQLRRNLDGRLNTWAVRWYASWLRAGGVALFPRASLVENIGFDGTGVHSGARESYLAPAVDTISVRPIPVVESSDVRSEVAASWRRYLAPPRSSAGPVKRATTRLSQGTRSLARRAARRVCRALLPEVAPLLSGRDDVGWRALVSTCVCTRLGRHVHLSNPHRIHYSTIGEYTYVSYSACVSYTAIGKFCSIGPNFHCGWGIHPTDGISTSPVFYSASSPCGPSFSTESRVQERKPIRIGNDVLIGMDVKVLDGVTIGDGAVIGAGAVVVKDIPPYAIAVGCPARVVKYRFDAETIQELLQIRWWDWPEERLREVERRFFDVDGFVRAHAGRTMPQGITDAGGQKAKAA